MFQLKMTIIKCLKSSSYEEIAVLVICLSLLVCLCRWLFKKYLLITKLSSPCYTWSFLSHCVPGFVIYQ
jgi:hypothetical protein